MDTKEKDYDADRVMAELRESLKKIHQPTESTTLNLNANDTIIFPSSNDYDYGISSQDTITITSPSYSNSVYNNTVVGGGYSLGGFTSAGIGSAGTTGTYTVNAAVNSPYATTTSTKIHLDGENADIMVNGWSLVDAVKRIEQRMGLLQPNPEMEKEWTELKELGDKYRALEVKLKEQINMWEKLKEMPPPKPLY